MTYFGLSYLGQLLLRPAPTDFLVLFRFFYLGQASHLQASPIQAKSVDCKVIAVVKVTVFELSQVGESPLTAKTMRSQDGGSNGQICSGRGRCAEI